MRTFLGQTLVFALVLLLTSCTEEEIDANATLPEFISYSIGGMPETLITKDIRHWGFLEGIIKIEYISNDSSRQDFGLIFDYETPSPFITSANIIAFTKENIFCAEDEGKVIVSVTKFGAQVGETIEGNFEGIIKCLGSIGTNNSEYQEHQLKGAFKVILE